MKVARSLQERMRNKALHPDHTLPAGRTWAGRDSMPLIAAERSFEGFGMEPLKGSRMSRHTCRYGSTLFAGYWHFLQCLNALDLPTL